MTEELTYKKNGDYLIPDLEMDPQPEGELGKYGKMRQKYLKDYHGGIYSAMMIEGKLWAHLLDIDREAEEMENRLTKQMKEQRGITEQLKATNQMRWVQEMNNIQESVDEIIRNDLIYS
ncbi:MAG: TnpV protein [Oscillospiraceae bacterium]|nr:TnpV protein [Oscillospiraceae bacterium]